MNTFLFRKDMTPIKKLLYLKAMSGGGESLVEATATGNPLSFTTDVSKPLKSLTIPWTPIQSGSGDPSPTNVRSISGVSALSVWQTGKNLFDGEYPEIVPAPLYYRAIYVGNETVTVSSDIVKTGTSSYSNLFALAGNVSTGAATGINDVREGVSRTITPINGYITLAYRSFEDVDPRDYHTQIEVGSTATPYTTYTGTTYPIVFPDEVGTVYGGSLDVVSGVLTANHVYKNAKNLTWNASVSGTVYTNASSDGYREVTPETPKGRTPIYCNIAKYDSSSAGKNDVAIWWGGDPNNGNIVIRIDSIITSKDAWLSYIAENDVFICYRLATPLTYQLTPQQIQTIIGDNVLWSDTNGTNTAVYLKKG